MPSPCYPHALSPRSLADISGADKQWNVALQPVEACPARADPVTGQMKHHHRVHWLLLISAEIGAKRPSCTRDTSSGTLARHCHQASRTQLRKSSPENGVILLNCPCCLQRRLRLPVNRPSFIPHRPPERILYSSVSSLSWTRPANIAAMILTLVHNAAPLCLGLRPA